MNELAAAGFEGLPAWVQVAASVVGFVIAVIIALYGYFKKSLPLREEAKTLFPFDVFALAGLKQSIDGLQAGIVRMHETDLNHELRTHDALARVADKLDRIHDMVQAELQHMRRERD